MLARALAMARHAVPVVGQRAAATGALGDDDVARRCRVSSRIVASLICGASTCWAHPFSRATRRVRRPPALEDLRLVGDRGARQSAREHARRRGCQLRRHKPSERRAQARQRTSPARNSLGFGSTVPKARRNSLSYQGRGRSSRCGAGRDRQGACSSRPKGRSSCRLGTRGSGRHVLTTSSWRAVVLQHVLDQVDAPARAVEFIAKQHDRSGRSRCRTRNARRPAGSFRRRWCPDRRVERQ